MATIKSYTSLQQSKKLAEILPLESADMLCHCLSCWSLAALLDVLPKIVNNETLFIETSASLWHIGYRNIYTARTDNPVDACYELILQLHKLKKL